MHQPLRKFFAVIDMTGGTPGSGGISKDELTPDKIFDELLKDDVDVDADKDKEDILEKPGKKIEDKEKDKKIEETEVKDEDDEELEVGPTDEQLNNIEEVPRAEILKEYPDLFKKFPQLEHAYYREQKYAELLPTLEDAQTAVDKSEEFDKYAQSVDSGNLEEVLNAVKTNNPEAFGKIVDNYLPNLAKIDQNAYYHLIGNVIKNTISSMVIEGNKTENDNLKAAAIILNQYIFGKSDYEGPKPFSKESNKENTEIQNERAKLVQERYESSVNNLTTRASNTIKSTISKYIDPRDSMTDYVKRTAINEALNDVQNVIASDSRFKAQLDKLWEKAFKDNFSMQSQNNIRKAYLSKAKTVLPNVIRKHRNEALKGLGKRVTEDREEPEKKGLIARGRASTEKREKKSNEIPAGMKSIDYLMSDD